MNPSLSLGDFLLLRWLRTTLLVSVTCECLGGSVRCLGYFRVSLWRVCSALVLCLISSCICL